MWIPVLILAYLVGSVPFAVVVAKMHGVSILESGSGNPGATNVCRTVGKWAGYIVFLLDGLKGAVAVEGAKWVDPSRRIFLYGSLAACVLGHSFSPFLRFRGGKGVAATVGGLLFLTPFELGIGLVIWLLTFWKTRIVSLSSMGLVATLPFAALCIHSPLDAGLLTCLSAFIVGRHRRNLTDLFKGSENCFSKPKV
jgi:glycerol-3-phosphate acyltransferase PlsY